MVTFDPARYDDIIENSRRWWAGELKRPLIQIRLGGKDPGRPNPEPLLHTHEMTHDFSVAPERIVDKLDYQISQMDYLGDAFPYTGINLGPGITSAWMGALDVDIRDDTVWFFAAGEPEIADVHFEFDGKHPLFERLKDVHRAANEFWNGAVQVSMTDLGGNLDLLNPYRPGEKLLLDLYDSPEEVKRLTWEGHKIWWRYFEALNTVMKPPNPGYLSWLPIFSDGPTYILQCDFCYMIGPEMFDEFVKPELTATCRRLAHSVYHLDGIGALANLDSLLSIEELDCVQWVYGDGQPGVLNWLDVYKKVRDAGKLLYLHASPAEFETVVEHLGSSEGIILRIDHWVWDGSIAEAGEFLAKYGMA